MQKPLVVARQELVNDSVNLVNGYGQIGVPMFVIADVLEEVLKEVRTKAQEQYATAKEQYEQAEAEEAKALEEQQKPSATKATPKKK